MALAPFLTQLFDSGRVAVTPLSMGEFDQEVHLILQSAERTVRLNICGEAPEFLLPVAAWAGKLFYYACQFVVCRDIDASTIAKAFEEKCPALHSPSTDYSADLVFRYLPDLLQLTRSIAADDPLLERLRWLAREWPLSSVGVSDLGNVDVAIFIDHPAMLQLYVDRVISRADVTRLGPAPVDQAIRSALGAFPELCPPIAKHLGLQAEVASGGVS